MFCITVYKKGGCRTQSPQSFYLRIKCIIMNVWTKLAFSYLSAKTFRVFFTLFLGGFMLLHGQMTMCSYVGQGKSESKGHVIVGSVDGNAVFTHLAQEAVGAYKEIEFLGMQVKHHATGDSTRGNCPA